MTTPKRPVLYLVFSHRLCLLLMLILSLRVDTAFAQISIPSVDQPVTQDFNTLANSGSSSTMPAGWTFVEFGGNALYTAGAGTSATADTYSFGTSTSTERALGELTGTVTSWFGASFTNNTGTTITSLLIQFYGEQWRLGATGRTDKLYFDYSTDATSLTSGTWTNEALLSFTAPVTSGTVGALNGNLEANRVPLASIITGLSIANGSTFWIRWSPFDATGADDGLGIDDFVLSANPNTHYTISTSGGNVVITDIANNGETMSLSQVGTSMRCSVTGRTFSLNGAPAVPLPADIAIAGQNSFTIEAKGGDDIINLGAFTSTLPSLTINGGLGNETINFNGDINFQSNANLDVNLQDDDPSPGIDQVIFANNTDINVFGAGYAEIEVSRNVVFNLNATLRSEEGDITIKSNQQATPTTGTFVGVSLTTNALIKVSDSGNITILGKGGTSGASQYGIQIDGGGAVFGGTAGNVVLHGTGGASASNSNIGVNLNLSTSIISSNGANVMVAGTGGGTSTSQGNVGIQVSSATISAGGTGQVTVNGTGGQTVSSASNMGLRVLNSSAKITSSGGNVHVTGIGGGTGASPTCTGIDIQTGGLISAGGSGTVIVSGTGGTGTSVNQFGIAMGGATSLITSSGGDVMITGMGGGTGTSALGYGVYITAGTMTAGGNGDLTIMGTGGTGSGTSNMGVALEGASSFISTGNGDLTIIGTGHGSGSGSSPMGVYVNNGASIESTGLGNVSVTGSAGSTTGNGCFGVYVIGTNSRIVSSSGNVTINGTAGGTTSSLQSDFGVGLISGGTIAAGVNGALSITGTGGLGTGNSHYGIYANGAGTSISSFNGNLLLSGIGGGNGASQFNDGIYITNSAAISVTGAGSLHLTGQEGAGSSSSGITINNPATVITGGGDIVFTSNSIELSMSPFISTPPAKSVTLETRTAGVNIVLENAAAGINGGPMYIAQTELANMFTGLMIIGNSLSGNITIADPFSLTTATDLHLISADDITFFAGPLDALGGDISLTSGAAPDDINPTFTGTDVIAGTASFSGNLHIPISGVIPESDYPVLTVEGSVNLTGITLTFSGTILPAAGTVFTILQNDGADPISGTFSGLSEGATIPAFLGGQLPAVISYVGGTGNDVTITVQSPDYLVGLVGSSLVVTDRAGNSDILQVSQVGSDIRFFASGRTYSLNGAQVTSMPVNNPIAGLTIIDVDAGGGADQVNFLGFTTSLPGLTVHGGTGDDVINFNGDINFLTDANLTVDLQSDDPSPGFDKISIGISTADLNLSGSGSVLFTCSANIAIIGHLTTEDGDIIFHANDLPIATSGNFSGISVNVGSVTVTGDGDIYFYGKGGDNLGSQYGIYVLNGGSIQANGTGNLSLTGYGGASAGNGNTGIVVTGTNARITSVAGTIHLLGYGGGSANSLGNHGIGIISAGKILASNNAAIEFEGYGGPPAGGQNDGVRIGGSNSEVTTENADITILGFGGGQTVGSSHGVNILSAGIIHAGGSGQINMTGTGGLNTGSTNIGINIQNTGTLMSTDAGDIHMNGTGGGIIGTAGFNYGVNISLGPAVTPGPGGNISITGIGGEYGVSPALGIQCYTSTLSTTNADIMMYGEVPGGGSAANVSGIQIIQGSTVQIMGSGRIHLEGHGGYSTGNNNYGVRIGGTGTNVSCEQDTVDVIGYGGGLGVSATNGGVFIESAAHVTGGLTGGLHMEGHGGFTSTTSNYGIYAGVDAVLTSNGGDIRLEGYPGPGIFGHGIDGNPASLISSVANGGNIQLIADVMNLRGRIEAATSHYVLIETADSLNNIDLGIAVDPGGGPLSLADFELDSVVTGQLIIGNNHEPIITIYTTISREDSADVWLQAYNQILFNNGAVQVPGGNLVLHLEEPSGIIIPAFPGPDVLADTTTLEGNLSLSIAGTLADVDYSRLWVNGVIDLNDVLLEISGIYVPMPYDTFVLVNNDASEPIMGAFSNYAEGDTLHNIFGSIYDGLFSYSGGDGNDAIIAVLAPCAVSEIPGLSAIPDTLCAGTPAVLSIVSGNLGNATNWHWYTGDCGDVSVGVGNSIMVNPTTTTTYFARGEGGCVTNANCGEITIQVNPLADATILHTVSGPCYYTDQFFQPEADEIPGASYTWHFGAGAIPATASGYGPHTVQYISSGMKTVSLVIHPNAAGADCADSSVIMFNVTNCPGQILGKVLTDTGVPLPNVNIKLFVDANTDGMADTTIAIRNIFTSASGQYVMANLLPGSYVLLETQPFGWLSHDDGDNTPDGDIVPNIDSLDNLIPVTIFPAEFDSMNLFIERPAPGSINGSVFDDFDGDMMPDADEGLSGVTIRLLPDANHDGVADSATPVATTVTGPSGFYQFASVMVGHYVLVELQPAGYFSVKDFDASPDGDAAPNMNMMNDTIPVTLANNEIDANNYFIDAATCSLLVTNPNDSGPGSFRNAISCAALGDTITFHNALAGDVIELNSAPITFSSDVVVMCNLSPVVGIKSSVTGMFVISPGTIAEFHHVELTGGISGGSTGTVFDNQGELRLYDTGIKKNPLFPVGEYLIYNHNMGIIEFYGSCSIDLD